MPTGKTRPKAECHSERPHRAKGLCSKCYDKQRAPRIRKQLNGKERKAKNQSKRLRNFRMTKSHHDLLIEYQSNRCAICNSSPLRGESLCIDHSHTTGDVRGLLCHKCNRGLGFFRDNPDIMWKGIDYLVGSLHRLFLVR